MEPPRKSNRPDLLPPGRASKAAALPAAAVLALAIGLWPLLSGLQATFDDGFYYLEIARRMAGGEGSTFDGLQPTNGYHPLWLLCLVALFRFVAADQALAAANVLQALLAAAATGLVYRTARLHAGRSASTLAALLWIDLTYRLWLSGLEWALHAACLLAVAHVYSRDFTADPPRAARPYLVLGILCAAATLARLDAVLLAVVLAATLFARLRHGDRAPGFRRWWVFALPVMLAVLGYALGNLLLFGHAAPVSGAVKSEWSEHLLREDPLFEHWGWAAAKARHLVTPFVELRSSWEIRALGCGLVGILLWCGVVLLGKRRPALDALRRSIRPLGPLVGFAALHYLAYGLLFHGAMTFRPWYYAIQPWLGAVLLAAVADRLARGPAAGRRWTSLWLAPAVLALMVHTARGLWVWRQTQQAHGGPSLQRVAAEWVDRHLPPEARIGSWNAGILGWFSNRRVVDLDGLANSWQFFEEGRHDLCRYWQETAITHLVDAYRDGQFWTLLPTLPRYRRCADRLELVAVIGALGPRSSLRVYRLAPVSARRR